MSGLNFSLKSGETTFYVLALGGGGEQENISGTINGVDITAITNIQVSSDVGPYLADYENQVNGGTVGDGTFNAGLTDIQAAFTNLSWDVPGGIGGYASINSSDAVIVQAAPSGVGFDFPSSTARLFKFSTTAVGVSSGIKSQAAVILTNLSQAYSGNLVFAGAKTVPAGLTVNLTYNGSPSAPINPGSYKVIGTVSDPNYYGSATNTLVVTRATAGSNYPMVVDPLIGTYDQCITVTNNSGATMAAVMLVVSNLPAGVTLYNATGNYNKLPYVLVNTPVPALGSGQFELQFTNPRRLQISDKVSVLASLPAPSLFAPGYGVPMTQVYVSTNFFPKLPQYYFAFAGLTGTNYNVYSSTDQVTWYPVDTVTAPANVAYWSGGLALNNLFFRVFPQQPR